MCFVLGHNLGLDLLLLFWKLSIRGSFHFPAVNNGLGLLLHLFDSGVINNGFGSNGLVAMVWSHLHFLAYLRCMGGFQEVVRVEFGGIKNLYVLSLLSNHG